MKYLYVLFVLAWVSDSVKVMKGLVGSQGARLAGKWVKACSVWTQKPTVTPRSNDDNMRVAVP